MSVAGSHFAQEQTADCKAPLLATFNLSDEHRFTRTNPKTLCGQKKPPAHMADEVPRHYFRPERTRDRRARPALDLPTGHYA